MRFDSLLFYSILLGSAVQAGHPRKHRRSQRLGHAKRHNTVVSNNDWAGAVWQQNDGTFECVTGTLTIPALSSQTMSSAAAAWVGIDGNTCSDVILLSGVGFSLSSNEPVYKAWYEWYPSYAGDFTDVDISAGDVVRLTVRAPNGTSGIAMVENLSNNQSAIQHFESPPALCGQNVEWVVQSFEYMENIPLVNFSTVAFTDAYAGGRGGQTFGSQGATVYNINQNSQNMTSVSVDSSSVTIQYL